MKRFFHSELEAFRSNIVLMGERCLDIVQLSIRGLLQGEVDLVDEVIARDDAIDRLEVTIDSEAIRYISLRAPVATELRLLTVGMKVGHDLERVGDESVSIAKRTRSLAGHQPIRDFLAIPHMAELAQAMLRDSIDSFLEGDAEKAIEIPVRDRDVDRLNHDNYSRLAKRLAEEPDAIASTLDLMFISKSLERVADHATNIAEEVVFLLRGEDVRHASWLKARKADA